MPGDVSEPRTTTRTTPSWVRKEIMGGPRERIWPHHAALLAFTMLWGGNFVLAEVALHEMTPITFSAARFVMGGLGMLGVFYLQGYTDARRLRQPLRLFPVLARRDWPRLLFISVLGATLAPWLGIEGLNLTYAGRAAFWLALAPVASAGFGYALRTERINRIGGCGLVLAGLGTLGLAAAGLAPGRNYWLGDLLLLLALLLTVAELHLIKPLAVRYGAAPIVTARTLVGGLLYILVATPAVAEQSWSYLSLWTWAAIVVGGMVGVGVGQWVKVRALQAIGPTQVVIYGNMVPLATLFLAWVTIGTQSMLLEVVAGILIVAGALLLQLGGAAQIRADAPAA